MEGCRAAAGWLNDMEGVGMIKQLQNVIVANGDRGAIVPFSRIDDLKQDMMALKDGDYHSDWLNRMVNHVTDDANKFIPSNLSFEPRSLISVVMPSQKAIFQFCYRGGPIDCTVPPVQTNFYQNNNRVLKYLSDYLSPLGFSTALVVSLPHKLLSVRCGLGMYGRNNIFYNDDFGSYAQIMTYLSDLPCDEAEWFPIRRMERCANCSECVAACPTGAIGAARQLIDADRCITYFNEPPGEFPEWLDRNAHNCVVGCMLCQDCCPENDKNKNNYRTGISFTEEETSELLNTKDDGHYSESLAAKLELTCLLPEFTTPDVLPRNLAALLRK